MFSAVSRLVFDQIKGYRSLAQLAHKSNITFLKTLSAFWFLPLKMSASNYPGQQISVYIFIEFSKSRRGISSSLIKTCMLPTVRLL